MADEAIAEVRRVRHEISRRCDHDPRRVVAYYRAFQEELKRTGKYRFVGKGAAANDAELRQRDAGNPAGR
jgi:hypothetical protein